MTKYMQMTGKSNGAGGSHQEVCLGKRQFCPLRKCLNKKFFVFLFLFLFFILGIYNYQFPVSDDQMEYTINDTMSLCYENFNDKRSFQSFLLQQTTNVGELASTTTTTTAASAFSASAYGDPGNVRNTQTSSAAFTTNSTNAQNSTNNSHLTIYFVTPTYPRSEQIPELIRLGQTLMHIPNLHWIVADDNRMCSSVLENLLNKFGIPFTYLASPMPEIYRNQELIPRGVANRRAALNWMRNNNIKNGILYFGDDDNTFDLKLFPEIRSTKRVSMFPVGLVGDYGVSTPIVKDGKVVGFFDGWPGHRRFPVDMAGFAVNLNYFAIENATMPYRAGLEEDEFLKSIDLKLEHIEPKAKNCTEILVWHTQTKKKKASYINTKKLSMMRSTSLLSLFAELKNFGVSFSSETKGIIAHAINYVGSK